MATLKQANTLASWSFVGVIVPIIGWILIAITYKNIQELPSKKAAPIRTLLTISLALSLITAICGGYIGYRAGIAYNDRLAEQKRAAQQAEVTRRIDLQIQQALSAKKKQTCYDELQKAVGIIGDNADNWTKAEAVLLVQLAENKKAECESLP